MITNPVIITKRNVDSQGNCISIYLIETKQIFAEESVIVLRQVPDEAYRIKVQGYKEVFDREKLKQNEFKVDYVQGVIYFHPKAIGKTVVIEYYGIGYELISCSRIFTKYDKYGNVLETLEELIGNATEQLELIKTLGDSVAIIDKLETSVQNGNSISNSISDKIVEVKNASDTCVNNVNTVIQKAKDEVINVSGNKEFLVLSSEWVLNGDVYEKQLTHTLNSENLHVTTKDRDTKDAVMIGYKILDKSNILLKSDEAINMSIVLSASYYHAVQTISDNVAEEVIRARKSESSLDNKIGKIDESIASINEDLDTNIAQLAFLDQLKLKFVYGAKGDGITDDTEAFRNALTNEKVVYVPKGVYCISDTIQVGRRGYGLIGCNPNVRNMVGETSVIKYIGEKNNRKTVILLGSNNVGEEPTIDGSGNALKNIHIDCNDLVGFGVYGAYLTNETIIDNVCVKGSLEYNFYLARAWYATFTNLISLSCRGNGIALGMPLEYLDGTKVNWTTSASLELNECKTENIRSHNAGQYFSVENKNTYTPLNVNIRRKGYGIGAGIGNAFILENFLSEGSGGCGLYVYTDFQPIKNIKKGYLEANCSNSGLNSATEMANIIIENISDTGGTYYLEDIFCNYNGGGIYHTGKLGRKVRLKNLHQPRFLKSLDGLGEYKLYSEVLKENVYYGCGYYNTLLSLSNGCCGYGKVNTRYSFTVDVLPSDCHQIIMVKGTGTTPLGSFTVNYEDGTTQSCSFGTINHQEFEIKYVFKGVKSITKSGGTGDSDSYVIFKIVNTPATFI